MSRMKQESSLSALIAEIRVETLPDQTSEEQFLTNIRDRIHAKFKETRANMTEEQRLDRVRKVAERIRIDGDKVIVVRDGVVVRMATKAKNPERVERAAARAQKRAAV